MSYTILSRIIDCGDGYGKVIVDDTTTPTPEQIEVNVDLNHKDDAGHDAPQITLPDGTEKPVDAAFVSAYRAMGSTSDPLTVDRSDLCHQVVDGPTNQLWLGTPLLLSLGSLGTDHYFRKPLAEIPGFDGTRLGDITELGTHGLGLSSTYFYTRFQPQLSPGWQVLADVHWGGAGLAALGYATWGGGGDEWLYVGTRHLGDVTVARLHDHLPNWVASLGGAVLGGLALGLGATACNDWVGSDDNSIPESQAYVSPEDRAGFSRADNPYTGGTRFPRYCTDLSVWGGGVLGMELVRGAPDWWEGTKRGAKWVWRKVTD